MDPALIAQGVAPTLANTVEARFIGRLTPGSDRFNGAFQASATPSRAAAAAGGRGVRTCRERGPRFNFRGGWGIFFDRPQGNMVWRPSSAPRSSGPARGGGERRHRPTVSDIGSQPHGLRLRFAAGAAVERRLPAEAACTTWWPSAPCSSHSDHQLRQEQINSIPSAPRSRPATRIPTKAASATPGASAWCRWSHARGLLGYNNIRMWDYSGNSNYNALQAGVTRRFDKNYMFSAFYVWSKSRPSTLHQDGRSLRRRDHSPLRS